MPYLEHKNIFTPDEETKIWRYMDFTKFLSFLEKKSSFFCRADIMEDKFEGALTESTLDSIRMWDMVEDFYGTEMAEYTARRAHASTKNHFLNCWHMNDFESVAMWKLYTKTNESVAIQSRIRRLKHSFDNIRPNVYLGKINYLDYDSEEIPDSEPLLAYFYKRKNFEHENELRAIFVNDPQSPYYDSSLTEKHGLYLSSYVKTLIESVYVSPSSSSWFKQLVESITVKYGLDVNVVNSRIDETPIY